MVLLALLLAQTTAASPIDASVTYLLSFGSLGLLVVLALLGYVDLRPSAARAREERLEAMNKALVDVLSTEIAPTMKANVEALATVTAEQREQRTAIHEMTTEFGHLRTDLQTRGT